MHGKQSTCIYIDITALDYGGNIKLTNLFLFSWTSIDKCTIQRTISDFKVKLSMKIQFDDKSEKTLIFG